MTVHGMRFTDRAAAGEALSSWLRGVLDQEGPGMIALPGVAHLGGHSFDATVWRGTSPEFELAVAAVPDARVVGGPANLDQATALVRRMENRLAHFEAPHTQTTEQIETSRIEISRAHSQLEQPFPHALALAAARQVSAEIDQTIAAMAAPPPEAEISAPPAGPAQDVVDASAGLAALPVVTSSPRHPTRSPASPAGPPHPRPSSSTNHSPSPGLAR